MDPSVSLPWRRSVHLAHLLMVKHLISQEGLEEVQYDSHSEDVHAHVQRRLYALWPRRQQPSLQQRQSI